VIISLLVTVANLPEFGQTSNPVNNEVSERYIEKGLQETGAVNIVTGMILDYRAFDTFGESHVLFIAVSCVFIILRVGIGRKENIEDEKAEEAENDRMYEPKNDRILQRIAFILVPLIFIFGIYVILFGHLGPGGGFSGGAIIGAGLILYLDAFGFDKAEKFFTLKTFRTVSLAGLLTYAAAKSYSFFTGANHIESIIPLGTPGHILSSGLILVLNICVGAVVSCTMYAFYVLFRKGDF
jgi:multicomponent Na+:H+ antiporter subunit B